MSDRCVQAMLRADAFGHNRGVGSYSTIMAMAPFRRCPAVQVRSNYAISVALRFLQTEPRQVPTPSKADLKT